MSNFNFCQECCEQVPKSAKFCKYCGYPFTKEAEAILASKNKPRPKPVEPDREPEDEDEEEEAGDTVLASADDLGPLEVEIVSDNRPQKFTFEQLIKSPRDSSFTPRKAQKISKKQFQKEWQAEAGNSRVVNPE